MTAMSAAAKAYAEAQAAPVTLEAATRPSPCWTADAQRESSTITQHVAIGEGLVVRKSKEASVASSGKRLRHHGGCRGGMPQSRASESASSSSALAERAQRTPSRKRRNGRVGGWRNASTTASSSATRSSAATASAATHNWTCVTIRPCCAALRVSEPLSAERSGSGGKGAREERHRYALLQWRRRTAHTHHQSGHGKPQRYGRSCRLSGRRGGRLVR